MPGHTTLADHRDLTGDAAAVRPAATGYLRYLDILRALDEQGAVANSALLEAHIADSSPQRQAALAKLHTRLRDMAATANDALGNWPERSDGTA